MYTDNIVMLNAVTANTTSLAYDITRRGFVTIQFFSTGSGLFTVDESNDGINWITSVGMIDAQGSSAVTLVTSKTATGGVTGSTGVIVPPGFRFIRVNCVAGGGASTAILQTVSN